MIEEEHGRTRWSREGGKEEYIFIVSNFTIAIQKFVYIVMLLFFCFVFAFGNSNDLPWGIFLSFSFSDFLCRVASACRVPRAAAVLWTRAAGQVALSSCFVASYVVLNFFLSPPFP